jgi:hypothetical protein
VTLQYAIDARKGHRQTIGEVETDKGFRQPGIEETLVHSIHHGDERLFPAGSEVDEKRNAHKRAAPILIRGEDRLQRISTQEGLRRTQVFSAREIREERVSGLQAEYSG